MICPRCYQVPKLCACNPHLPDDSNPSDVEEKSGLEGSDLSELTDILDLLKSKIERLEEIQLLMAECYDYFPEQELDRICQLIDQIDLGESYK